MSVEYSVGICYGMILSDKEATQMKKCFPNEEAMDNFSEQYLQQINAWTGGDWFLGLCNDLGSNEVTPLTAAQICWDKADLEKLEEEWARYNLGTVITWEPQKYLIQFCY